MMSPSVVILLLSLQTMTASPESSIQKAKSYMSDAEYSKAQRVIRRALAQKDIPEQNLLKLYHLEATCWVSVGNTQKAQSSFLKLLTLDPGYSLAEDSSRKERLVFEDTVQVLSTNGNLNSAFEPIHVPIGSQVGKEPIQVFLRFGNQEKANDVDKVSLFVRRQGKADFTVIDAVAEQQNSAASATNRFQMTIPQFIAGEASELYAMEYYLEAYSKSGIRVVQVGSETLPLTFLILPENEFAEPTESIVGSSFIPIVGAAAGVVLLTGVITSAVGVGVGVWFFSPKTGSATVVVTDGSN